MEVQHQALKDLTNISLPEREREKEVSQEQSCTISTPEYTNGISSPESGRQRDTHKPIPHIVREFHSLNNASKLRLSSSSEDEEGTFGGISGSKLKKEFDKLDVRQIGLLDSFRISTLLNNHGYRVDSHILERLIKAFSGLQSLSFSEVCELFILLNSLAAPFQHSDTIPAHQVPSVLLDSLPAELQRHISASVFHWLSQYHAKQYALLGLNGMMNQSFGQFRDLERPQNQGGISFNDIIEMAVDAIERGKA